MITLGGFCCDFIVGVTLASMTRNISELLLPRPAGTMLDLLLGLRLRLLVDGLFSSLGNLLVDLVLLHVFLDLFEPRDLIDAPE